MGITIILFSSLILLSEFIVMLVEQKHVIHTLLETCKHYKKAKS